MITTSFEIIPVIKFTHLLFAKRSLINAYILFTFV